MADRWSVRPSVASDYAGGIRAITDAVAAEGRWIGAEAPVDHIARQERFEASLGSDDAASFVAVDEDGAIIGNLGIGLLPFGVAELGMLVEERWRGRGVGAALLTAGIDWARDAGAHKLALQLWPHNERARALYEKFGFVQEGYLTRHYRRSNGELWDAVIMGLALD